MTQPRAEAITFVETCALALWLGASLFFAAIVAPAAFDILPTAGLAGVLVGRILPSLFITGMVVAAIILGLEARAPRPGARLRGIGAGVMLIACAVAQFVIGGQIERLRSASATPIGALSRDDPRRVAFGRLHALSVAALAAAMIAAAASALGARGAATARS
jgi:hypothetical protein